MGGCPGGSSVADSVITSPLLLVATVTFPNDIAGSDRFKLRV